MTDSERRDGLVGTLTQAHHVLHTVLRLHVLPARSTELRVTDTGDGHGRSAPHLDGLVPQIPLHVLVGLPHESEGARAVGQWMRAFDAAGARFVAVARRAETAIGLHLHADAFGMQWEVWTSLSRSVMLPSALALTHARTRVVGPDFLRTVLDGVVTDAGRREAAR